MLCFIVIIGRHCAYIMQLVCYHDKFMSVGLLVIVCAKNYHSIPITTKYA